MFRIFVILLLFVKGSEHSRNVFSFGPNENGELGIGTTSSVTTWDPNVVQVGDFDVSSMSSGRSFTLFLDTKDDLYGVGNDSHGQFGLGSAGEIYSNLVKIGSDVGRFCALEDAVIYQHISTGYIYSSGNNEYGQLLNGSVGGQRDHFEIIQLGQFLEGKIINTMICDWNAVYVTTTENDTHFFYGGHSSLSVMCETNCSSFTPSPFPSLLSTLECDPYQCRVKTNESNEEEVLFVWGDNNMFLFNDNLSHVLVNKNYENYEQIYSYDASNLFRLVDHVSTDLSTIESERLEDIHFPEISYYIRDTGVYTYGVVGNGSDTDDTSISFFELPDGGIPLQLSVDLSFSSEGRTLMISETFVCDNITETNVHTCNSNGSCTSNDHCDCYIGYGDIFCNLIACGPEYLYHNESSCSGHGDCVAREYCLCDAEYYKLLSNIYCLHCPNGTTSDENNEYGLAVSVMALGFGFCGCCNPNFSIENLVTKVIFFLFPKKKKTKDDEKVEMEDINSNDLELVSMEEDIVYNR